MSRYISYLNSAEKIISAYNAQIPFASYLKSHFAKNKKYGSGDRKAIASLCYSYFRTGHLFNKNLNAETLLSAAFLCTDKPIAIIDQLKPEWAILTSLPAEEKLQLLQASKGVAAIFPFADELDESTDAAAFCKSLLFQPSFFIRIRPGNTKAVLQKLHNANISYQLEEEYCLRLNSGTNIEEVLQVDKEVVVQDANSQKVLDYLRTNNRIDETKLAAWDCCAASGGKSILLNDILPGKIQLTVSDIRPAIIGNLKKRLAGAGIAYSASITDLNKPVSFEGNKKFDVIICDAPCTGSGTWGRTPEQLYFFNKSAIDTFSELQKNIVSNIVPHLKPGGLLFYITCSVFKKENQDITTFIQSQMKLQLLSSNNLYGYQQQADSMFVSVFKMMD